MKNILTLLSAAVVYIVLMSSCSNTGEIRGKVIYATQLPAHDIIVYTMPPSSSVMTNAGGEYAISKLQPDEYTVIAKTNGNFFDSVSKIVLVQKGNVTTCDLSF